MKRKNGFTLLELLIAAAIIGTLAIFATQSFRNTSSEIRKEDALARARVVAAAAKRFMLDHPTTKVSLSENSAVLDDRNRDSCGNALSLQNLIHCGYLEYRQYTRDSREGDNYKQNFKTIIKPGNVDNSLEVCVVATSQKITLCKGGGCCVQEKY